MIFYRPYILISILSEKSKQMMQPNQEIKDNSSQQEYLLDGLNSVRLDNLLLNESASSQNDDSFLLESIKDNILLQSHRHSPSIQDSSNNFANDQILSKLINHMQMDNLDNRAIEERPEENFTEVNESLKQKSQEKEERKESLSYEIMKDKLEQFIGVSQQPFFSQFNNIIKFDQTKEIQQDNPFLVPENDQVQKQQEGYQHQRPLEISNDQYLLNKCEEIYDQLKYKNHDTVLSRIPEDEEDYSFPQINMTQANACNQTRNNYETVSNISLDSSALINLIPLDSIKNEYSDRGNEIMDDEHSKNKLFKIFKQKDHNYIRQIIMNKDSKSLGQEKNYPGQSNQKEIQTFYIKCNNNPQGQQQIYSLRPTNYQHANQNTPMEIQYIENNENQGILMQIQIINNQENDKYRLQGELMEFQNVPMEIEIIQHKVSNDDREEPAIFNEFLNINKASLPHEYLGHLDQRQVGKCEYNGNLIEMDYGNNMLNHEQGHENQQRRTQQKREYHICSTDREYSMAQRYNIQITQDKGLQSHIFPAQRNNLDRNHSQQICLQNQENHNNLSLNVQHDNHFSQNGNDFTQIIKQSQKQQPIQLSQQTYKNQAPWNSVLVADMGSNKKIQTIYQIAEEMMTQTKDIVDIQRYEIDLEKQQRYRHVKNQNEVSIINILLQNQEQPQQKQLPLEKNIIDLQEKVYIQIKDSCHIEVIQQKGISFNQNCQNLHHQSLLDEKFNHFRQDVNLRLQNLQESLNQKASEVLSLKLQRQRKRQRLSACNVYSINDTISTNLNKNPYGHHYQQNQGRQHEAELSYRNIKSHQQIQMNQIYNHQNFVEKTLSRPQAQQQPYIKVNLRNNQICLDIFGSRNNSKTLQQNIMMKQQKQQGGSACKQINPRTEMNNGYVKPGQRQKVNDSRQSLTEKRNIPKEVNEKDIIINNISTDDEQFPQNHQNKYRNLNNSIIQSSFQSKEATSTLIETYDDVIKQSQIFLMKKDEDNKIVEQFEKLVDKHVFLRFTPYPKTSLGQQLFKNGLFLVAMIGVITRLTKRVYTTYHVYMHVHNFYGESIAVNKYVYSVQLQRYKLKYEEFVEQSYQHLLNKTHPQINVQAIKRKNLSDIIELPYVTIKKIDNISIQQQTSPKKTYMRQDRNIIDEKIVFDEERKQKKLSINQLEQVTQFKPNPRQQLPQYKINRKTSKHILNNEKMNGNKRDEEDIEEKRQSYDVINRISLKISNQAQKIKQEKNNANNYKNLRFQQTPNKKPAISALNTISSLSQKLRKYEKVSETSAQKYNLNTNNATQNNVIQNTEEEITFTQKNSTEPITNPVRLNNLYEKYRKLRENRKSNLINHGPNQVQIIKEEQAESYNEEKQTIKSDQNTENKKNKKLKHVEFVDIEETSSQPEEFLERKKKKLYVSKGRKNGKKDNDSQQNSVEQFSVQKKGQTRKRSKK